MNGNSWGITKIGYDVKIIDLFALFYDEEKISKLSDEDAIRLCLLLSLEVIFMGRDLVSVVDDVYLRMVNDLDAWNLFPWGEHVWRQLYDSIRNVSSKHKLEHLAGLKRNPNHVPSYSLNDMDFDVLNGFCNNLSSDLSVLNGFCNNLSQTGEEKGDCEIIRLVDQRQQDHISNMAEVDEQKIQSEIQRLYNHSEARLNKIAEEDKQRKCLGHINSSAHMKLAIECCVPKKRKYVDVVRSLFCALPKILNVPSIKQLANQKNVLSPLMIEKCKSVKPWIEDLSRPSTMDNVERMRDCLKEKIPVVLKETGVFEKKNIDPAKYKISFKVADGVPKQGGVFDDCGVFRCMFLYRLANGIPLALDDPL
ncbi:hypothetical protein Tco_1265821 [Tanacetum coccineum]